VQTLGAALRRDPSRVRALFRHLRGISTLWGDGGRRCRERISDSAYAKSNLLSDNITQAVMYTHRCFPQPLSDINKRSPPARIIVPPVPVGSILDLNELGGTPGSMRQLCRNSVCSFKTSDRGRIAFRVLRGYRMLLSYTVHCSWLRCVINI
jgi:hypothetical protein